MESALPMLTSFLTLTAMETVLGIDNIIFISILVGRLPVHEREKIRKLGIALALLIRIGLLFSISWLMSLTAPFLTVFEQVFSGRDLILLCGGLFLIVKSTLEIHHKIEDIPHADEGEMKQAAKSKAGQMLLQILLLDIVFSLDSVITAVGMVSELPIMISAMIASMLVMLFSASSISDFVDRHPSIKILALSFLLLIGVMLVAESTGTHVGKGYIYFAMCFSLGVELLNMRYRKKVNQKKN